MPTKTKISDVATRKLINRQQKETTVTSPVKLLIVGYH